LKQPISGQAGRSFALGASVFADGINFSVFSKQANRVSSCCPIMPLRRSRRA
jgi:pullulanase/glycogen debranching enzyme